MDVKEQIDALCARVIVAPDGSKELEIAMEELRSALAEHIDQLREQLAHFRQKAFLQE
jgi:hypothetical protein